MENRRYKAIFFDLDGTLLNLDMDVFLKRYFADVSVFAQKHGFDGDAFVKALGAGVQSMINETGGFNSDRFWDTFCALMKTGRDHAELVMNEYYATAFNEIGATISPRKEAALILKTLKNKGYPLYLTTMPLFPRIAVEQRLMWAGCPVDVFDRITTYDNSTSTKPHIAYYQENVDCIGLNPEDILMIGNNTHEDLAAMELGLDAYLVTDYLLDPIHFDLSLVKHGSLVDLLSFVQSLDFCE